MNIKEIDLAIHCITQSISSLADQLRSLTKLRDKIVEQSNRYNVTVDPPPTRIEPSFVRTEQSSRMNMARRPVCRSANVQSDVGKSLNREVAAQSDVGKRPSREMAAKLSREETKAKLAACVDSVDRDQARVREIIQERQSRQVDQIDVIEKLQAEFKKLVAEGMDPGEATAIINQKQKDIMLIKYPVPKQQFEMEEWVKEQNKIENAKDEKASEKLAKELREIRQIIKDKINLPAEESEPEEEPVDDDLDSIPDDPMA